MSLAKLRPRRAWLRFFAHASDSSDAKIRAITFGHRSHTLENPRRSRRLFGALKTRLVEIEETELEEAFT